MSIITTDQIDRTNVFLSECIDLIPIVNWGFDESIKEKLQQFKHELVDESLTNKEQKRLSKSSKQRLSKTSTMIPKTITQLLKWMKNDTEFDNGLPKKATTGSAIQTNGNTTKVANGSQINKKGNKLSKVINASTASIIDTTPSSSLLTKKIEKKLKKSKNNTSINNNTDDDHIDSARLFADHVSDRRTAMIRLKTRIDELKSKRLGQKSAEEIAEAHRIKRQMSKLKLRERKKAGDTGNLKKRPIGDAQDDTEGSSKKMAKIDSKQQEKKPAVTTDDGRLIYSKFDFVVRPDETKDKKALKKEKRKANRGKLVGKDYKRLLEKVTHRNDKIEQLRSRDEDKADRLATNIKWDSANQRAEGLKVKDDPDRLRKSLKRKEKKKQRSHDKWQNREHSVQSAKEKRQNKREGNIEKRKNIVKKKKIDRARKKGRML